MPPARQPRFMGTQDHWIAASWQVRQLRWVRHYERTSPLKPRVHQYLRKLPALSTAMRQVAPYAVIPLALHPVHLVPTLGQVSFQREHERGEKTRRQPVPFVICATTVQN